jgi:hypothetical protein
MPYMRTVPVFDGVITPGEWNTSYTLEFGEGKSNNDNLDGVPYSGDDDFNAVMYYGWDKNNFYLAAEAYDDCFERHRLETRWLAVVDLDEFIVPVKDKTIPEFLHGMEKFSVVEINWLVYGSGGAKKQEPGTVMERFHKHSLPGHRLNTHVKSIVDPRRVCTMTGCHEAARITGSAVDSHGVPLTKGFRDRVPQQDVIRINHYAVKSYEEFLAKRARGRARVATLRDMGYFESYDLNDIED